MSPAQMRRDGTPAFDSKMFYTLRNANAPKNALSAGIYTDTNGAINMTGFGAYSSENWQLFFQSGRYFIRNYDYGANWQLGITEESRSIPKLYKRSGSISQQWTINSVAGGWELVNGLWGEGTVFALPKDWLIPAMRSEKDGEAWNITSNPSAAQSKPPTGDMLSTVTGFESPSSASTTIMNPGFVSTGQPTRATPAINTSASTPLSVPTVDAPSPSTLPGGAIAGTAIGAIAFLASIIFAFWFVLIRKRKEKLVYGHGTPHEVEAIPAVNEKYAHFAAEMEAERGVAELASREKAMVYELDSSSVGTDSLRKI